MLREKVRKEVLYSGMRWVNLPNCHSCTCCKQTTKFLCGNGIWIFLIDCWQSQWLNACPWAMLRFVELYMFFFPCSFWKWIKCWIAFSNWTFAKSCRELLELMFECYVELCVFSKEIFIRVFNKKHKWENLLTKWMKRDSLEHMNHKILILW